MQLYCSKIELNKCHFVLVFCRTKNFLTGFVAHEGVIWMMLLMDNRSLLAYNIDVQITIVISYLIMYRKKLGHLLFCEKNEKI